MEIPQKLWVGGGVKKENKLKQEQRKKGQQYATCFFVGVLVYVHGLCDGKFWNISLLSSLVDNMS